MPPLHIARSGPGPGSPGGFIADALLVTASGSLLVTGRFSQGKDRYPAYECRPTLYTSLGPYVALGERLRHTNRNNLTRLATQRQSRLRISLSAVLDLCSKAGCHALAISGLDMADLCHPSDYERSHLAADFARMHAEAVQILSCTLFPEGNLIIFTDRPGTASTIDVEETVDPDLILEP